METAPTLPDFALALKPDEYQLPPVDASWNQEHTKGQTGFNQLRNDKRWDILWYISRLQNYKDQSKVWMVIQNRMNCSSTLRRFLFPFDPFFLHSFPYNNSFFSSLLPFFLFLALFFPFSLRFYNEPVIELCKSFCCVIVNWLLLMGGKTISLPILNNVHS